MPSKFVYTGKSRGRARYRKGVNKIGLDCKC